MMKTIIKLLPALVICATALSDGYAQDSSGVTVLSQYNNGWTSIHGVFVRGNYAYVAAGTSGLAVVNISDKTAPSQVGIYNTAGSANEVVVVGNYAYVADQSDGLVVIDISTPSSPTYMGRYDTPSAAIDCVVDTPYVYVADYAQGLRVVDVSDPTNPTSAGFLDTPDRAIDLVLRDTLLYLADQSSGLRVIDVSDPTSPSLVGVYDSPGKARGVGLWGKHAFIADYSYGMRAVDVSNPAAPSLVSVVNPSGAEMGVWVNNGCVFLSNATSGLRIYDITNAKEMSLMGNYDTPGYAYRSYFVAPYVYVADSTNFGIYDASEALEWDSGDDRRWVPTEYLTIQAAVNATDADDTVLVRRGIYYENIVVAGNNNLVASLYLLTSDQGDRDSTIINGGGIQAALIFRNAETAAAEWYGFNITGGAGTPTGGVGNGGGIICISSTPTISNCLIKGNSAVSGGGFYLRDADITINSSDVCNNSAAQYGGGIACLRGSDPTITGTVVHNNSTIGFGGGIAIVNSAPNITGTTEIYANSSENGSGIFALNSDFLMDHTLVTRNTGPGGTCEKGAGIFLQNSDPTIDFCTIARNFGVYGMGLYLSYGSDPDVLNSILWDDIDQEVFFRPTGTANTIYIDSTDLRCGIIGIATMGNGTKTDGGGLIQSNPLFVNYTGGDYNLTASSPCIGAAEGGNDMGALPFGGLAGGGSDELKLSVLLPARIELSPVHPNPFNARLTIPYQLPEATPVTIAAYDIQGRLVATLLKGQQPAGFGTISWQAGNLPGGVYLIRMETPGATIVQRALLLK